MKFWKMNGTGNDFIILNNIDEKIPEERYKHMAKILCNRHLSIGADGLMVVDKASDETIADYRLLFYNSDGTTAEMCGNGARCICRYGYETGLAGDIQKVETIAGIVIGERLSDRIYKVRLNNPGNVRLDEKVEINGETFDCAYMELGNPGVPHAIVHIEDLKEYDNRELLSIGRSLRYYTGYPKGANVNFYEIIGDNYIFEKTYERGVEDFTYACGTGTGAVVAALTLKGEVSGVNTKVDMKGGQLVVDAEMEGEDIKNLYLTGITNIVIKGDICDEEFWEERPVFKADLYNI